MTPSDLAGVRWIPGDLAACEPTLDWPPQCDTVIYLAQSRNWRRFPEGAADVLDVNIHGVCRAVEYARRSGAARFVYASSGSVYAPGSGPSRETDPIDLAGARSFYAASKLAAELLLAPYAPLLSMVVLRLFVPYGPGQLQDMLIPQLLRRVKGGEPIGLDGDDGLRMNPVAVCDVAEVISRCLTLDRSVTINVAGPEVLTLREIGRQLGRILGCEPRFEQRPGQATTIVGDTTTLSATLGWTPQTLFADGLQALIRHDGVEPC